MQKWIDETIKSLSLREKIAQLASSRVLSHYVSTDSDEWKHYLRLVSELQIGGITFFQGNVPGQLLYTQMLQEAATIPLLVAQDAENGIGMRLPDATVLPHMMAVGATGNPRNAYDASEVTARESRALGVHHVFAPVCDVNNNPSNPIINIRSFGSDPKRVSDFVDQAVKGLQDNRVIATAKHFPGHGDTSIDTHLSLAELPFGRDRLDQLELVPFRAAFAAGVRSVMVGHLAVPELDPTGVPASLSKRIVSDLLRKDLAYDGLIVTDALDMQAITNTYGASEAAVMAIEAGVDMLVLAANEFDAVDAVEAAVESGRIAEGRINDSVRRVLREKVWAGAIDAEALSTEKVLTTVASEVHLGTSNRIAEEAVARMDSLGAEMSSALDDLVVVPFVDDACTTYVETLKSCFGPGVTFLEPVVSAQAGHRHDSIVERVRSASSVLIPVYIRVRSYSGSIAFPPDVVALIKDIATSHKSAIVASLGSPYFLGELEGVECFKLATFSTVPASERALAQVLLGKVVASGKSPVV